MGLECYLMKGDGGQEVEIHIDPQQQVRKLIHKLAEAIGADPTHIRIQGGTGLIMLGSEDSQKIGDCFECPVISYKVGQFQAGRKE